MFQSARSPSVGCFSQSADGDRADCPSLKGGGTEKNFSGFAVVPTPLFPLKGGEVSNHKGIFDESIGSNRWKTARQTKSPQPLTSYGLIRTSTKIFMVPRGRLELPRHSSLPPQDSVSTSSTTWAQGKFLADQSRLGKHFFPSMPALPCLLPARGLPLRRKRFPGAGRRGAGHALQTAQIGPPRNFAGNSTPTAPSLLAGGPRHGLHARCGQSLQ